MAKKRKKRTINEKIAKIMLKKRKKLSLTRGHVADNTGLHINTIKNIEESKGGMNVRTLQLMCKFYGMKLSRLFYRIGL